MVPTPLFRGAFLLEKIMRIGLEPSTQWSNSVVGGGNEALYMQDVASRLKPILVAAGHKCEIFAGQQDANSDGAHQLVLWGANLALSIHSDAGGGPGHWEALTCKQETRSARWYTTVMETYCASMRFSFRGQQVNGYRNRGYMQRTPGTNGVAVIRIPESVGIPTTLVEVNWHDRDPDAAAERTPDWRQLCAEGLARGVLAYLGGAFPPLPPMMRKEEAVMYCPPLVCEREGDYYVWDIPDMFNSLPQFQAVFPGLTLHNRSSQPVDVYVWVTRDDKILNLVNGPDPQTNGATFKVTVPGYGEHKGRTWVEMSQYIGRDNYIGGASLTVKCKSQVGVAGGQLAKWK